MEVSRKDLLLLAVGLLPSLLVAVAAFVLVPSSAAVYAPVASHLPIQMRFVFSTYYLCVLLPVLVLGLWHLRRNSTHCGPGVACFGLVGSSILLAFGWWAVYQPELILQLIGHPAR
jgi:hypothetical protein